MRLDDVIKQSTTCDDFCKIFHGNVNVQIDTFWGVDSVSIEGYDGTVSSDLIARKISEKFGSEIKESQEKAALQLADLLKNKLFIPLRDRLTTLDKIGCALTLTYKIRNCARIGWTPEDRNLTAGYIVLKHSMCVLFLDKSV